MINEQIMTYVAGERVRGVTDDAIRGALISQGWKDEDVSSAMGFGATAVATGPREFSFRNLFEGRLMRWQYFVTSIIAGLVIGIPLFIALGALSFFADQNFGVEDGVFDYLVWAGYIIFFPITFSLMIRRLHDLNWSGWLSLIIFVPIIGGIFGLVILFKKGTDGPNTYGPPQADRSFKNTLLNL